VRRGDVNGITEVENAGADSRRVLDGVIAAKNTVVCLVVGNDAVANDTSARAARIAGKVGCEPVQVVHVRDERVFSRTEAPWKPAGGKLLTLLTMDRKISARLTAAETADDGDLLIAMTDAIAGRVS
jgi:hypothetical protein